jgi:hypothetical protein
MRAAITVVVGLGLLALTGCVAPRTRVVAVTMHQIVATIGKTEEKIFLNDRASRLSLKSEVLPDSEKREEVYVQWTGPDVTTVKLEYRQINVPNKISVQSAVAEDRQPKLFQVRGDDFLKGGQISAWRVTLWNDTVLLAEKKSTLW